MRIILVHDHFEQAHLDQVVEEMKTLGAPTIKAVDLGEGLWAALEGCHRLRAAEALGLTPEIEAVPYDDETTVWQIGLADYQDEFRVCEIVDGSYSRHSIEF